MTVRARHRRVYAHRMRRWSAGPNSWLNRLSEAAYDGHTCLRLWALPAHTNHEGARPWE